MNNLQLCIKEDIGINNAQEQYLNAQDGEAKMESLDQWWANYSPQAKAGLPNKVLLSHSQAH